MPRAPRTEPRVIGDIADAAELLRSRGGRFSAARRRVLEALFAADGPVSAEYIAEGRGGHAALELTSVYRTLEHLETLGVVRHVHIGHGPGLYALTGPEEHEYLACERCGSVTRVASDRLDPVREQIRERFGYEVRFSHFPMLGLCGPCAGRAEAVPADPAAHAHGDRIHAHPHAHDHEH